ncbi:UNVERIFIED_CONTAM: hypothetical protein Sradi_7269600 [Sesamum radiatum]|uniref:DUF4283 domain-containing protein n=1 Tax=Sesamum radiatum TaxID=300843 RepID=A0AAW2IIM6_SESRA
MIKAAVWNVRGLNNVAHQNAVAQLARDHNLHFLGLLETRVRLTNVLSIRSHLLRNWTWFDDYSGPGGRIWLAWNSQDVDVDIIQATAVGYVLGKKPYFPQLEAYVRMNWMGLEFVSATSNGFYFFQFKTVAYMEEIIEGGPWLFQGQPIVLQCWEPGMSLRRQKHTKIPGRRFQQKLIFEYEWLPQRCKLCCSLGHSAAACPEGRKGKSAPVVVFVKKKHSVNVDSSVVGEVAGPSAEVGNEVEDDVEPEVEHTNPSTCGQSKGDVAHVQTTSA